MHNFAAEFIFENPVFKVGGRSFDISIHDARAEKITADKHRVVMDFPCGLDVYEETDGGFKSYYTDSSSQVIFDNVELVFAYTLEEKEIDGERVEIKREIEFQEVINNVCGGKWQLEFINWHYAFYPLFYGAILADGGYTMRFELEFVPFNRNGVKISYLWNEMFEEN
ncbi:MAG: hypothetical protein NC253_11795 [Ruminococcus sp.]|nr:hypothetical protein [Ruminococcus sp.]MCM1382870.1 hypothetical protein [Muribaculaceae bacterium]MCM1479904.1 hypothetical protein [Muribaculaceae bacterium]